MAISVSCHRAAFKAIVYAGVDPLAGEERRPRDTAPTYDEAQVVLTRLLTHVDEDRHPKSGITVRQAVSQWLEVAELEDTTRAMLDGLRPIVKMDPSGHWLARAVSHVRWSPAARAWSPSREPRSVANLETARCHSPP